MAIDQDKIDMLRAKGGEAITKMVIDLNKIQTDSGNEKMAAAGDKFSTFARNDIIFHGGASLKQLNNELVKNPQLSERVKTMFIQNPEGFERIVPQLFKDPASANTLIPQAAPAPAVAANTPASPPANPNKPSALAAVAGGNAPSAPASTGPADAAAAKANTDKAVQATAGAIVANAANPSPDAQMAAKLAKLEAMPGFSDLLDRFDKNPALADLKKRLMEGGGKGTGTMLDTVLAEADKDPDIFKKWTKTIDENPGTVSSIAATFSNSPETALMGIGALSSFAQSDFGKSGLGKMLIGFIGKITGMLQGSENLMLAASNNGTNLAAAALGASSNLRSMTLVNGNTTDVMTGDRFRKQAANQTLADGSTTTVTNKDQAANEPQYSVPKQA